MSKVMYYQTSDGIYRSSRISTLRVIVQKDIDSANSRSLKLYWHGKYIVAVMPTCSLPVRVISVNPVTFKVQFLKTV